MPQFFLCPLKSSDNLQLSDVFKDYKKKKRPGA